MRKIKFRGKSINGKEWVFGSLLKPYDNELPNYIYENLSIGHAIIPETIGQFTGLTDKNGVEIYDGDIVKVDIFTKNYCIVFGESEKWGASFQYKSDFSIYYLTESFTRDCLVIGNIFDNPELL